MTLPRFLQHLTFLAGLTIGTAASSAFAAGSLVTDISSHLISVTSDFTGADLLLFGSVRDDESFKTDELGDIIVVVRGPQKNVTVRKKERVAGIWVNTESVEVRKVPGFYAAASNRPVDEITTPDTLDRLRIGPNRLVFQTDVGKREAASFKEAIIRQQGQSELYTSVTPTVHFLGPSLFRTTIHFPANVPVGNYTAEFYLFQDKELISAQSSPLFIKKFGLGRQIFDFAQNYPTLHGIAAILVALFAGWVASALFRKD
ncbi:MAG: TIGR02186 family protein [Sneathiella sp.]|nr:TIGR02186 family protein [Sneathiella sp.]